MQFRALAVVRQLLSAEARFQSQAGPCGIFSGQSGTVTRYSTSCSIFPRPYSYTSAPYLFIYHRLLAVDGDRGCTVVKVLCCKSEGRWFDSICCHWNFSLT